METSSPQVYKPLPHTGDAIRLLRLQPGIRGEKLRSNMIYTTLKSNPIYEALSYEWGAPEPKQQIALDDTNVVVTPNLWSALSHLRHRDEEKILWVDALCINQDNLDERNHQVRQMGEIYSRASMVIIWLGCPSLAESLTARLLFDWINIYGHEEWSLQTYKREYHPSPDNLHLWHDLARLGTLSYWRRTWIVQEIVLAGNISLQYGNNKATWTGIEYLERGLSLNDTRSLPRHVEDGPIMRLQHQHKLHHSNPPVHSSLEALLEATKTSLCGDPRDRVFALVGIAAHNRIKPDYSKTLDEIFIDVLKDACYNG
ncbi:heterokaryon incompatibility protein-domain-containing protein, partial [Halenospora varia]